VSLKAGYWSFLLTPGDPYVQGFGQYLDLAISWAGQCGLKVWIDLHGAPGCDFVLSTFLTLGSQNGFDNSGRRGPIEWPYGENIDYTQQALQIIVKKYSVAPFAGTVVGIELLNEPLGGAVNLYVIPVQH
jgi:glucan 1,3-beta-glucosidase